MRHCYVLRVFTTGAEGGNHLGVVTDVTGLDPATMQRIATDLGFSETVFLDWVDRGVPYARIFTPAAELPFAGHPLVGAAWVLGVQGPGTVDRIECGIGMVDFAVDAEGVVWLSLQAETEVTEQADGRDMADRCGIPDAIATALVALPKRYFMIEVEGAEAVTGASPNIAAIESEDFMGAYMFARDGETTRARFFAPAVGVAEDPATGSAAVALAAYLQHTGIEAGETTIHQGAEIGFPSVIRLAWDGTQVHIGGSVVRDEVRVLDD